MKQKAMRNLCLIAVMLTSAVGCWNSNGFGECTSDEDLTLPSNYYENAICEDGHAACAEGNVPCKYVAYRESKGVQMFTYGCVPQDEAADRCVTCPEGMNLCVFEMDQHANGHSWVICSDNAADCWSQLSLGAEDIPVW